jgi:hypothetical protein
MSVVSQILGANSESQSETESIISGEETKHAMQDKIADESMSGGEGSVDQKPEYDKFAAKFAALSRKEKAMREKETQLEQRLKQIEEESKTKLEKYSKYDGFEERIKNSPLDVLTEYGITPDVLAKIMLEGNGKPTIDMQLSDIKSQAMSEIEKLKKELADKEQQSQQKQYEQTINSFKADIQKFVESESEYEMIRQNDASHTVFEVIEQHAKENPGTDLLTIKEASDMVENYLLEQAKKLLEVPKLKSLLTPKEAMTEKPSGSATLSNSHSAQVPNRVEKKLSDSERMREAAKLIRWEA